MKEKTILLIKSLIRPLLFIAGGAAVGFAYYNIIGCASGSCPITSNPVITVIYSSVLGFLVSVITKKENK